MHKLKIESYINKEIKGLLVIKEVSSIGKGTRVECKCVSCGQHKEVNLAQVLSRKGNNSCGCRKHALGSKNPRWKGYGEISSVIFSQLKRNARLRKLSFNITIEQIWDLFLKQGRKCALTGLELKFGVNRFDYTSASLDRIDSKKGYTIDNVQWVHRDINYMKQEMNNTEFVKMATMVVNHAKET